MFNYSVLEGAYSLKVQYGESRVSFVFAILKTGLGDTGSEGVRAEGAWF